MTTCSIRSDHCVWRGAAPAALLAAALVPFWPGWAGAQESGSSAVAAPRRLAVNECVDLALRNNVDVRTAGDQVTVTEAQRSEARGHAGPRLRVDAYAHEWNSAFNVPFALQPGQPPAAFPVRDQFEWNATVSVVQPLTGLWAIVGAEEVRTLGVDIAKLQRELARRQTAHSVIESYYRVAQGQRLVAVASASIEQLQAHLRQSISFHDNGVVSQDDVLRAKLALANAQQRLIQTRARVSLDQARLAVAVGLPADTIIDPVPLALPSPVSGSPGASAAVPPTAGGAPAVTLAQAEATAEAHRVELVEIAKRADQAEREVKLAWLRLAPQVNAVGAYIHNVGSRFTQKDSAYVGAAASWDVWDWGVTSSGISQAKARAHQAALARGRVLDEIHIDVRGAYLGLTAAREAISVAQASVALAEENFRLVNRRYQASAATSFDVVDAEALLTTARGQVETALYDQALARASLRRAMGMAPEALASND